MYKCLSRDLGRENYSQPLQGWLDAYPREQVYLIQVWDGWDRGIPQQLVHLKQDLSWYGQGWVGP